MSQRLIEWHFGHHPAVYIGVSIYLLYGIDCAIPYRGIHYKTYTMWYKPLLWEPVGDRCQFTQMYRSGNPTIYAFNRHSETQCERGLRLNSYCIRQEHRKGSAESMPRGMEMYAYTVVSTMDCW